mmetsp:Transcript_12333/g.24575  ORF Transcript_12333/g.24575 Transcript_12333/m.24575 type:complete len:217 (-) Transcript_12333:267-917(-)
MGDLDVPVPPVEGLAEAFDPERIRGALRGHLRHAPQPRRRPLFELSAVHAVRHEFHIFNQPLHGSRDAARGGGRQNCQGVEMLQSEKLSRSMRNAPKVYRHPSDARDFRGHVGDNMHDIRQCDDHVEFVGRRQLVQCAREHDLTLSERTGSLRIFMNVLPNVSLYVVQPESARRLHNTWNHRFYLRVRTVHARRKGVSDDVYHEVDIIAAVSEEEG